MVRDDAAQTSPEQAAKGRRAALGLLALLLTATALAACKDVAPGSGVETIEQSRERSPPSGR